MTDNTMEYMTASMCGTAEWCRGYNAAVTKANAIIDRQNAEIERLNGCVKSEDEVREIMKSQMTSVIREITNEQIDFAVNLSKAKAIKDFAERVKVAFYDEFIPSFMADKIDNLVKEITGEQE